MRSSFTQGLPLAMVLEKDDRHGDKSEYSPRFCEVSESGESMTCVGNRQDWLFRRETTNREWTWNVETTQARARVVHPAVYHFPDADLDPTSQREYQMTLDFLKGSENEDPRSSNSPFMGRTVQSKVSKEKWWFFYHRMEHSMMGGGFRHVAFRDREGAYRFAQKQVERSFKGSAHGRPRILRRKRQRSQL